MCDSTPSQLRFPAIAGFTVRAAFEVGALSSDFGPLLLRCVESGRVGLAGYVKAHHRSLISISKGSQGLFTNSPAQMSHSDFRSAQAIHRDKYPTLSKRGIRCGLGQRLRFEMKQPGN